MGLTIRRLIVAITFTFAFLCISNRADAKQFIIRDTIPSRILNEAREILIYLPVNYFDTQDSYPLNISIDRINEDDIRNMQKTKKAIYVVIKPSSGERVSTIKKFIYDEVIPQIEKRYRIHKINSKKRQALKSNKHLYPKIINSVAYLA